MWVIAFATTLGAPFTAVRAQAPTTRPAATTPSGSPAVQAGKLVTALRKPGITPEQRQQLVDELLKIEVEGPRQLAKVLVLEVDQKLSNYLGRIERAATTAQRARLQSQGGGRKAESEVVELRNRSMTVSRKKDLTKEQIKEICDPAVARLTELMLVQPSELIEKDAELQAARKQIIADVELFHQSVDKLPEDQRKTVGVLPSTDTIEAVLTTQEKVACMMAMPITPQDKGTLKTNLRNGLFMDPAEVTGAAELNRLRLLMGLNALLIDAKLSDASRDHSKDMNKHKFFAHESPVEGKTTPWMRAANFGTKASAENIYMGRESGEAAIDAWWYSPGHHVNMMKVATRVGMGRFEQHWTQMLGN